MESLVRNRFIVFSSEFKSEKIRGLIQARSLARPLIFRLIESPNAGTSAFSRNVPLSIARITSRNQSAIAFARVVIVKVVPYQVEPNGERLTA
jgi:hypothetical protein